MSRPDRDARRVLKACGFGDLYVAEVDGQLWASNRYWIAPAAKVAPLLSWWNLPVEPGVYWADDFRLTRAPDDTESVTMAKVIESRGVERTPLAVRTEDGWPLSCDDAVTSAGRRPLIILDGDGGRRPLIILDGDGARVFVQRRYARWLAGDDVVVDSWTSRGERKPVDLWRTADSDEWLGCVMPALLTRRAA